MHAHSNDQINNQTSDRLLDTTEHRKERQFSKHIKSDVLHWQAMPTMHWSDHSPTQAMVGSDGPSYLGSTRTPTD